MKFLSFVFCLAPTFLVAQEYDFSSIENSIAIHEEQQLISGTILISKDGSTLFTESFGYADWEHQTPITDNTRFSIGSITKSLTQIIVSQLVEEELLDLDESVNTYIPDFPQGEQSSSVTIAHLLNHRSGVPHRVTNAIDETQALNAQSIVERVIARGLLFEPGDRRLYSSAGYTSLARVAELASNASYSELLESLVFEPADMINAINEPGPGLLPNKARAYRLGMTASLVVKNSPYKDLRFLDGSASVYATTSDLLNLINAISAGTFGNEIRGSILRPNAAGRSSIAGRTNGYEAWIDYYPNENVSVVFLSNLQSASHWQIRDQILNVIEGREATDVPLPPLLTGPFEDEEGILGTYGGAVITKQDGKLFRGENEFYPTANNRYYIPGSGSSMQFERNTAGESIALIHINPDESTRTIDRSD